MIVNHTHKWRAKCDKRDERSTVLRSYNKETERLEPTNLFTCLFALLILYLVLLGTMRGVRAIKKEVIYWVKMVGMKDIRLQALCLKGRNDKDPHSQVSET